MRHSKRERGLCVIDEGAWTGLSGSMSISLAHPKLRCKSNLKSERGGGEQKIQNELDQMSERI